MFEPEYRSEIREDTHKGEVRKLLCSLCRHRTNHEVIKSLHDKWDMDDHAIDGEQVFLIVQCRGCEYYSFCKESSDSETYHDIAKADGTREVVYPTSTEQYPLVNPDFQRARMFTSMPKEIKEAYEETYKALTADLFKLGAAGMRLIIELVCLTQGITAGSLQKRIDDLHTEGVVTEDMKQLLHNVRLFGNKNVHTTNTPQLMELISGWDAVNTMLDAIYGTQDSNKMYAATKTPF